MRELLSNLASLQNIDTKLYHIEMLRGDLPKLVESLKNEMQQLEEEISSDQKATKNFQTEKSDLTNEQSLNSEKIKKFQDQLYKVTSNKEYEATSTQIEFCEQEIKRIKARVDEIDLKVMALEEEIKPKNEKLTTLKNDFIEREKELTEKISETAKEEIELTRQRQTIIPHIRKDILNKYERIRKAKNGLALAAIMKDSCGGCFNKIPPQIVIELRKKDAIRTCEFCGRILYYSDVISIKEELSKTESKVSQ